MSLVLTWVRLHDVPIRVAKGMTALRARPAQRLVGEVIIPGDKSISHRALMLAALADGTTHIQGFLPSQDCQATLAALQEMGVAIQIKPKNEVVVDGVGLDGLNRPDGHLNMGNSGTSMRLMSGLMAAQEFDVVMVGDQSLMSRPMKRIAEPLSAMGAKITLTAKGTAPIQIQSQRKLKGIDYCLPVASAQVKSCILLAGLYADGQTWVREPLPTRDHTERMLRQFGYDVHQTDSGVISLVGGGRLTATTVKVPADLSSAAFFMVGASIAQHADITLRQVGINPTRTGVIDILRGMGADIELNNKCEISGEPVADIRVRSAQLKGISVPHELGALAIDELPVLFVAAACAQGVTVFSGVKELRVKESDRIEAMAAGLNVLGVDSQPTTDGMIIRGGARLGSGKICSYQDHRVAMSMAMASLKASGDIIIDDCSHIHTSFPGFVGLANTAGLHLTHKGDI